MKRIRMLTVAALGALLVAGTVAGHAAGMPGRAPDLSSANLAGHFTGRAAGFITICLDSNNAFAACGSTGSTPVQFNATLILATTFDRQGNACGNFTVTLAPLAASPAPALVFQEVQVVTVTSFDTTTNTGEADFHNFMGGKCNGAVFDNTGASPFSQGTLHIAVTNNGNQIESMVETDTAVNSSIGSEILGWTSTRQTSLRR
jgi:hypothetical protein